MPTAAPTPPTASPSQFPTQFPTEFPSFYPTPYPTFFPSQFPTTFPTLYPSQYPTGFPTDQPTQYPTGFPTQKPTAYPSQFPTTTNSPSAQPTTSPSLAPTSPTTILAFETSRTYVVGALGSHLDSSQKCATDPAAAGLNCSAVVSLLCYSGSDNLNVQNPDFAFSTAAQIFSLAFKFSSANFYDFWHQMLTAHPFPGCYTDGTSHANCNHFTSTGGYYIAGAQTGLACSGSAVLDCLCVPLAPEYESPPPTLQPSPEPTEE